MSGDPLTYLHLLTPPLLALPLLSLIPSPPNPPEELPGIRPITIRTVTPRRGLIITTLCLLAFTSFLDVAWLVVNLLTADGPSQMELHGLALASEFVYAVGGFLIWGIVAIVVEWRARWGDRGVVILAVLGFVLDVPNMVLSVLRFYYLLLSTYGKQYAILSLVPPGLRLLLYPSLLVVVLSPIIRYQPADETTSLLQNGDAQSTVAEAREAYGTFTNASASENGASLMPDPSRPPSAPPVTPTATPATTKQPMKIPKKLGEVKKEDQPMQWKDTWAKLKKLAPNLWPSTSRKLQAYCLICVVLLAIGRVLNPLLPLSLGQIVRKFTQKQTGAGSSPWPWFIAYFAIRLLVTGSGVLYFVQQRLWIPVSQYTDREMMLLCFNHLLNLSLAYHTKRNTGEVLKIIDRGSAINNLFQTVLFTALPTFFDILIAFAVFFYLYGGLLAGITLFIMSAYIGVSVNMTQRRTKTRRILMDKDVKQRGIVSDVLTNWESVKYFTAEQREVNRFREAVVSYQETEARWNIDYQLLYLIQTFLLTLGLMSGALIIAYRVLRGTADAAEFVVFIQYFLQLSGPLDRLGWLYRQLNQNTTDAEKMFNLLSQATEVTDKPDATDLIVTDGVIEFDNVRFSYDGQVEALKGINFKINKGQSMALVGESGSGKSTILRLLYRFYDISSGRILIDGQDISKVTQTSLRKAIGIVPQDSVLWNDTIGANISYGKEGANDEDIIAAARAAKLHERILSFPEEYATIVGERGIRLSGGEKQRVSLARMFLKSPAILVLDEATSALDTETEREIQRALADLARNRSSLSIAHRLSTIINSDMIVVMKDGEVIENGAYKELLEKDGAFATMWKKQIFTEAEMVAQAQGDGAEAAAENLIDLAEDQAADARDDDHTAGGGDAAPELTTDLAAEPNSSAKASPETDTDVDFIVSSATSETPGETQAEPDISGEGGAGYSLKISAEEEEAAEASLAELAKNDTSTQEDDVKVANGMAESPDIAGEGSGGTLQGSKADGAPALSVAVAAVEDGHIEADGAEKEDNDVQVEAHSTTIPAPSAPSTQPSLAASPEKSESYRPTSPPIPPTSVPFPSQPSMQRMSTSQSQQSDLSGLESSPSASDLQEQPSVAASSDDAKKDKRRKRLSSIKGFVRRISDQGVTKSPSVKGGAKSPMGELDEATALLSKGVSGPEGQGEEGKKKKRLSLQRGKSTS